MKPTLIFVYNANSGIFNVLADMAHKIFSPATYPCSLCALTYSNTGMRKEWRQFIEKLGNPVEFLHADELIKKYAIHAIPLPAVFSKEAEKTTLWATAEEINACKTLNELQQLILAKAAK